MFFSAEFGILEIIVLTKFTYALQVIQFLPLAVEAIDMCLWLYTKSHPMEELKKTKSYDVMIYLEQLVCTLSLM